MRDGILTSSGLYIYMSSKEAKLVHKEPCFNELKVIENCNIKPVNQPVRVAKIFLVFYGSNYVVCLIYLTR